MGMQHDVAKLAGLVCEAVLYGILFVLTIGTLYVLLAKRLRYGKVNYPNVVTSLLMFFLATAQICIDGTTVFEAYVNLPRPERKKLLANGSRPINAAGRAIFFAMMILGDVVVIYRCYIIWSRNIKIVVLPMILSFTSAVLAYMTIWATQHHDRGMFILNEPWKYGAAIFSLSLIANAFSNACIVYRLWISERNLIRSTGTHTSIASRRSFKPILRYVIESGVLNTAYLASYMAVLYAEKGNGSLPIIADMATPMVGIIFSLLIVRAGLKPSAAESTISTRNGNSTRTRAEILFNRSGGGTSSGGTVHVDASDIELVEKQRQRWVEAGHGVTV